MKIKALIIPMLATLSFFASCNDQELVVETTTTEALVTEKVTEELNIPKEITLYVSAPSGLSLRKHNNLNSQKLAVMPHGTPVKVLELQTETTMTVGGIKGGMHKVLYNNKEGYAFNGYLSTFFPPEKGANAEQYVRDIQATHPKASFTTTTGGTASAPSNTETVVLPTTNWAEAFFIAQKLYDIPSVFSFPSVKGPESDILLNPKKKAYLETSELQITRANDSIEKIIYVQGGEGYGSTVAIFQDNDVIVIEWTAIVK